MSTLLCILIAFSFSLTYCASKIKVIYNNDNGAGCDPDNAQCFVHFLYYANEMDIQLIIGSGSTNCAKTPGSNIDEINEILDLYEKDYNKLNKNATPPYPTADQLRKISVQGVNHSNPSPGYTNNTSVAAQMIINIVDGLSEDEYVYYGAGAGLSELANALYIKPSIASKIHLYSIGGSFNNGNDDESLKYLLSDKFNDLWFVESNVTFRGMYVGGNQTGNYSDNNFDEYIIKPSGNLGNYYYQRKQSIKEGDFPSFLYILDPMHSDRNMSDPTLPNWGGQYKLYYKNKPKYYGDISSDENTAAVSVNQWRSNYLNDWQQRLQKLYM